MQLQRLWSGFSNEQLDYVTNIIKHSDAKSVCELGTFVGTTAKYIWNGIKKTNKKLYLVDNYLFLPEAKRQKFFNMVIRSIDNNTQNIIPILQNSHEYNWTQHNFIFFGHHDYNHMIPDLHTLMNSNVDYAIIGDGMPKCFQRTKAVFELLSNLTGKGLHPQYYLNGLIVLGRKTLTCDLPTQQDFLFGKKINYMPKPRGNYLKAIDELKRIY